ncbi:MAG: DMT family transporter, partial [Planctomycetales bacterium]
VLSIVVLKMGAEAAAESVAGGTTASATANETVSVLIPAALAAVLAACMSGTAYAAGGVMIRRTVTKDVSLSATLMVISTTGVVSLGLCSWQRLGIAGILAASPAEFRGMVLAGICNAVAFFSLSKALQLIPVARVNAMNASQVAMASAAGILFFQEALTPWLAAGVALTVVGLLLMDSKGH